MLVIWKNTLIFISKLFDFTIQNRKTGMGKKSVLKHSSESKFSIGWTVSRTVPYQRYGTVNLIFHVSVEVGADFGL